MTEPVKKKRKLPTLSDSFEATPRKTDSPEFHQGRKRVHSHVRGQWAAHIYLEFEPSESLCSTLTNMIGLERRNATDDSMHSLLLLEEKQSSALHLSLSKPLILQTNQRDQLRNIVKTVASQSEGFEASYASFSTLENDEFTRRFLSVEIGAGYSQMNAIVQLLAPQLVQLRLPPYYEDPRFHSSIAWSSITTQSLNQTLPWSPEDLVNAEKKFGVELRKESSWMGKIFVKIGQEVHSFPLQ